MAVISLRLPSRLPHSWPLRTTEVSPPCPGGQGLRLTYPRAPERLLPASSSSRAPGGPGQGWRRPRLSSVPAWPSPLALLCGALVAGFRGHPRSPGRPHLEILDLTASTQSFSLNKARPWVLLATASLLGAARAGVHVFQQEPQLTTRGTLGPKLVLGTSPAPPGTCSPRGPEILVPATLNRPRSPRPW